MTPRILVGLLLALAACHERASAAEQSTRVTHTVVAPPPPCDGCTVDVPATRTGALPLLVVLHGNHETARAAADRWRAAAVRRGWVVLALQCPRAEGCDELGRWYLWRGSPTWVAAQVHELAHALPIDPRRTYLAGWSGGASYVGMNAPAWDDLFAALVIHGGGQPPATGDCPERRLPTYFLVGDQNPAHPAAKRLRDYLRRCQQEVSWDLVPGADHAAEDEALDPRKAAQILDWLEDRARAPNVS